jgi:predicted transcriptional regulator
MKNERFFTLRLPVSDFKALSAIAKREESSTAKVVRKAIRTYLKKRNAI